MTKLSINRDRRARSQTDTFEVAISGLLTKRADTFGEIARMHERMIELEGDLTALDRVLGSLGYTGDLEAVPPRQPRDLPFKRGQVARAILGALRTAKEPLSTRGIAEASLTALGYDRDEDVPLDSLARRISQALQRLRREDRVFRTLDGVGNALWSLQA